MWSTAKIAFNNGVPYRPDGPSSWQVMHVNDVISHHLTLYNAFGGKIHFNVCYAGQLGDALLNQTLN